LLGSSPSVHPLLAIATGDNHAKRGETREEEHLFQEAH